LCKGIEYLQGVPGFYGSLSGKNTLEAGCGDGWISLRFAKSGANVWACDISPRTVQLAKRYAEAAQLDVHFETMICEEMSYPDGFFDNVFMHFSLHHCKIKATAKQIRRVLKPGGKAVFVEDYAYHPLLKLYRYLTPSRRTQHEHPLTKDDLSLLVSHFSSYEFEYSGLLNLFELSNNKVLGWFKPRLRQMDNLLYAHCKPLQKYSRMVIIKVTK
jgi:SAM-dependent methyltransferase